MTYFVKSEQGKDLAQPKTTAEDGATDKEVKPQQATPQTPRRSAAWNTPPGSGFAEHMS
jgi:hypothetical protein